MHLKVAIWLDWSVFCRIVRLQPVGVEWRGLGLLMILFFNISIYVIIISSSSTCAWIACFAGVFKECMWVFVFLVHLCVRTHAACVCLFACIYHWWSQSTVMFSPFWMCVLRSSPCGGKKNVVVYYILFMPRWWCFLPVWMMPHALQCWGYSDFHDSYGCCYNCYCHSSWQTRYPWQIQWPWPRG